MMLALSFVFAVATAKPLTLDDAVAIAVGNDPRSAQLSIEQERAKLRATRAQLQRIRATVDVNAQALYVSPKVFTPQPAAPYGAVLGLGTLQGAVDAPLFSGWRIESDIDAASALVDAAAFDIAAERKAVALQTAQAWWGVRRLGLLIETLRASDERLQESERLVKARLAAGLVAGLDENRAKSRRVQLDVEKQGLQAQEREALVRLQLLLGLDDEIILVDSGDGRAAHRTPELGNTPELTSELGNTSELVKEALAHRPELRAADKRAYALQKEETSTASAWWPQLSAVALAQAGNNPVVAGADARSVDAFAVDGNLQAGLVFRWNLFDTWATQTAVDDVGHRQRLAQAERRAAEREVESAVRLAAARVQSLDDQRNGLVRAQEIVGDNLVILTSAYTRGEVLFTEVLDAQLDLSRAERDIVDVDAQRALARLELSAAVGASP